MIRDFRVAIRSLLRSPAFTVTIVLSLALGVGANIGAFCALDTLLLKPLPYPEPQRLVALYETAADGKPRDVAEANLLDWQRRTTSFEAMAAYRPRSFGLTIHEQDPVTVIQTGMAMADFFRVIGIAPALGRTFSVEEETADARLLVVTDRLWRSLFAADPGVLGRKVGINEEPYTVIGVMPRGFEYPMGGVQPDAFLPLSRKDYCCGRLGSLMAAARLRPGVTLEHARGELASVASALAIEYPATNRGRSAGLKPLEEALHGARREPLTLLMAASGLLLLIACANAAGLMLARALARSRDTAVRIALGAGIGRLARPLFAEAALIGAAAAVCGLLAARIVLRGVPGFVPTAGRSGPLVLNAAAFAWALAISLAASLVLGLAPALTLRRSILPRSTPTRFRLRRALAIGQMALCMVLLLSTGLLLRSFLRLAATTPGFTTAHALRFGIGLPEKRYDTEPKMIAFHRELLRRLAALPGVEHAGAVQRLPLAGGETTGGSFQLAGANIPVSQRPRAWTNAATPDYFRTMEIPLLQGRAFSWQDDIPGQNRVAMVNQTFVRAYLGERRPLGTQLDIRWVSDLNPPGSTWTIVGVVADTHQNRLDGDPVPEIFLSLTQVGLDGGSYVIRARGDDPALPAAIAATVASVDPRIQRVGVRPLQLVVEQSLGSRRTAIELIGGFGLLALLLCAVGIYGTVAFHVSAHSREMAIRMALGATGGNIRRLILGHGLGMAAAGAAIGIAGFVPAARLLTSQLYGIAAADPATMLAVAAILGAVAVAACWLPARRAVRTSPGTLLRDS